MRNKNAIEKKYHELEAGLQNQNTFFVEDAANIWDDIKISSVYWYISALIEAGYIKRVRKGMYALGSWKEIRGLALSQTAQKVKDTLDEIGVYFYISGLDILARYMLHVPEQYPIILFAEKEAKNEVTDILTERNMLVVVPHQVKELSSNALHKLSEDAPVVLYPTDSFDFSTEGIAETEKAFVDLYYAVTRNEYPLSIQELVRIYENLLRTGGIDTKRMIRAGSIRSIQYDIRFIAESKYITEKAKEFEKILRKER